MSSIKVNMLGAQSSQQLLCFTENGSSGDGSNSGDASGKLGLMRSDKGSNAGSDGDGQGSGSGSDNGTGDLTELAANAEKGELHWQMDQLLCAQTSPSHS